VAAQRDMTSHKWKVQSNGVPIPPIRGTTQTRCGEGPGRTFRADRNAGDVGAEGGALRRIRAASPKIKTLPPGTVIIWMVAKGGQFFFRRAPPIKDL
jgi:hypothetical protein